MEYCRLCRSKRPIDATAETAHDLVDRTQRQRAGHSTPFQQFATNFAKWPSPSADGFATDPFKSITVETKIHDPWIFTNTQGFLTAKFLEFAKNKGERGPPPLPRSHERGRKGQFLAKILVYTGKTLQETPTRIGGMGGLLVRAAGSSSLPQRAAGPGAAGLDRYGRRIAWFVDA